MGVSMPPGAMFLLVYAAKAASAIRRIGRLGFFSMTRMEELQAGALDLGRTTCRQPARLCASAQVLFTAVPRLTAIFNSFLTLAAIPIRVE